MSRNDGGGFRRNDTQDEIWDSSRISKSFPSGLEYSLYIAGGHFVFLSACGWVDGLYKYSG